VEKYLSHNEIIAGLTKTEIKDLIMQGTTVRPNDVLQKIVCRLKPEIKNIVEIGTWRGLSSMIMASCTNVEHVWTFDINPSYFPERLWQKFHLENKITYICRKNSEEIYEEIKKLKFDFGFIDGSHKTEDETKDWNFMRTQCNRILADDTDDKRVFDIFSPYGAKRVSFRFGIWMANNDYSIVDEIKKDLIWDEPFGKLDFRHLDGR